ncbi:hypothetical protein K7711_08830 [Nocardia sp. CA2R105]|uniref:hypothetical protein n=1 Tax=Nocardia coffeae TaxID=2873381 RepID=UPI001CA6DAD4|nr:hypothetical protein [Nocardia coffeae]MBY8856578.1 hypothetical protein [Nocardia coffeae]
MVPETMCACGPATSEATEKLSELDARLLGLDPDLEELFAEIDEVLRRAEDRWESPPLRERGTPWPRAGPRCPPARLHGRRPGPAYARGRGPPRARGRLDAVSDDQ